MRIAILIWTISHWATTITTLAQPIEGERTDSTPGALKLRREVAGWIWDRKPTGTEERPHKCPYDPCDTACQPWAMVLSLGISCVCCQSVHKHCYYFD
ncbi:hypothetical protein PspLS_08114 [Pyricularia sp. CBS 133598]|nr:hypothetical protein PspLS_08114 [Pyricularia sp. CBS 133598]